MPEFSQKLHECNSIWAKIFKPNRVPSLQDVLYRSAKQDPERRFHALYDKVARSDMLARAWADVAANRGAPGVDGVTIADIRAGGAEAVGSFLEGIAEQLPAHIYRPAPLRRVHIPKPGKPGETRPLPAIDQMSVGLWIRA